MPIFNQLLPTQVICHDGVTRPASQCVRLQSRYYAWPNAADLVPPDCIYVSEFDVNDYYSYVVYAPRTECVQCADGDWILREHGVRTHDQCWYSRHGVTDGWLVRLCDNSNYAGEYCVEDDAVYVDGDGYYTSEETWCCESCSNNYPGSPDRDGPSGCSLCEDCYSDNTAQCDHCESCCWSEDITEDDDGNNICNRCRNPRRAPPPRLVSDYSDRSANNMVSESRDITLYGVELEVEARSGDSQVGAEWVRNFLPTNYSCLKHDGSLGPGGFEIVTRPDSVDVHKRYWLPLLGATPHKVLSSWQTGRCGMHVHVSRAGLSQLQLGKMLCFLNEPANENFIVKLAGRRNSRWSRIIKKKVGDIRRPYELQDRYVALNLCNRRTAEFRIFKGTLSPRGFLKNLEFCAALVEYTAPCKASLADATDFTKFCDWLSYKTYPYLYDWCVHRGYITDNRPPQKRKPA
jgi:hypothetical protein